MMKIDLRLVFLSLICSMLAVLLVAASTAHVQFSTGDEGWLWYGLQRTLAGEWPLRDFNSYDPGRYLFLAAWARLWGSDGIVVMRYGLALVQWLALFPALLLIARTIPNRLNGIVLMLIALLLAVWMAPRHKIFDIGAAVWMTCALAWLIAEPGIWRYRIAGAIAGLLWLVGRNHLLYGTISLLLACVWIALRSDSRDRLRSLIWVAQGYLPGLLPMTVLLLAVPGYATAYWHNAVVRLLEIGSTNLPLPIPWPWRNQIRASSLQGLEHLAVGLGFLLLPAMALIALVLLIVRRNRESAEKSVGKYSVLAAAMITTIAWSHQAFSRADLSHLAQASLPLAILLLAIPQALPSWIRPSGMAISWGSFAAIALLAMPQLNPAVQAFVQPGEKFSWQNIRGERLYVSASTAAQCQVAQAVVQRAGAHPSILFAPYFPGLYAECGLRCPVFDAYQLYPSTAAEQRRSIDDLEQHHTAWAVVWSYRIDGRPDLGFDRTDAEVWRFLCRGFQTEHLAVSHADAAVLHRFSDTGASGGQTTASAKPPDQE